MKEQLTEAVNVTEKTNGISRIKLYDYFVDSVLADVDKCVRFAATFVSSERVLEVVNKCLSHITND